MASLSYIPPVVTAGWLLGVWSPWYAAIYVLFSLPILGCIGWITWGCLQSRQYRFRAVCIASLLAGAFTRMAYLDLARPITYFDWINLSLGFLLALAGILIGGMAAHMKQWDIALILSCFWLAQAVSSFGWTLHLWERLNWVLDPALGMAAFLMLAWRLRVSSVATAR